MTKARIFLSYGRRDATDLAERLRGDLEAQGYDVWQDTRRIRSGKDWQQEIQDGLRNAQLLVALLSPHATRTTTVADSPDGLDSVCLDEISFARFSRPPKPVVPVMALPCEPPFCIYRLDYIDLVGWQDDPTKYTTGLTRLLGSIEAGLRGEVSYRSFEHQLRPWDFSAFLNEKRQHFFGREWLFTEIENWRAADKDRGLLIVGDPGTGKSAIVAELVHRNPGGQVLAYHCCQADTKETLQPGRFVRSVAALIASQIEEYARRLSDPTIEEALSEASCARDPASAFEAGVLTPLEDLPPPPGGARYILVDALDEALALSEGPSRTTIVDVLVSRLGRLPGWLRLLATTRKDRTILDRFRGTRLLELDAHDPRNLDDLGRYINQRLESPVLQERLRAGGRTAEDASRLLREKADGNILYVIRALEGVERGLYGFDHLDELPPGLYGLYLSFFNRHFPDEAAYAPVRSVLEVIVAARKPLSERRLSRATGLDVEADLPRVLRRLSAYLAEHDGRYTVYHKSLADWLTAPDNRGSLHYVSLARGHERLADVFWKEYQLGPHQMSGYALAYLVTHLVEAGRWDDLARLLCDPLFVEAKCKAGFVYQLQGDYDLALERWPGFTHYDPFQPPPVEPVPDWVRDCTDVVRSQPSGDPLSVHADKGAGPALEKLRAGGGRETPAAAPRFARGEQLPPQVFGSRPLAAATLQQMRERERALTGTAGGQGETPVSRVLAFANFVSSFAHRLAAVPQEALTTMRNHAASGPVARAAAPLADALTRPWLARDPRPPALPNRPVCVRTLEGHVNRVQGVALSPDGRTAVSTSSDSTLRVWDIDSGLCLRRIEGHRRSVRGIALAADGKTALTASHDNSVRLWDVSTGQCLATLGHHRYWVNAVALTPDATVGASAANDGTVRFWDIPNRKRLHAGVIGHGAEDVEVRAVALSRDGRLAVSAGSDMTLCVWDVTAGKLLRRLRGHTDAVNGLAMTPDARLCLSASRDRTVRVWDLSTGECLRVLEGSTNWVNAVAVTPDGRLAVSVGFDMALRVWDVATGDCIRTLAGHTAWIADVAVSADGRIAVSGGSDHTLRIWDLAGGESVRTLPGHTAWVGPTVLTPDRKALVSPARDHALKIWDAATGTCRFTLEGHTAWTNAAAVSPDGSLIASACSDKTVRLWDAATGQGKAVLEGHTDWVHHVAFTPDGRHLVSCSSDGTVRLWDAATGKSLSVLRAPFSIPEAVAELPGGGSGEAAPAEGRKEGPPGGLTTFVLTPDGRKVIAGGRDPRPCVWDLASGDCLHTPAGHEKYVECLAPTPDGRLFISGSQDNTLRVWDLATGECRHKLEGHGSDVEGLAVTPDGRLCLSASRDYTVRVWDLATGHCVRILGGHQFGVTGVALTPDGQLVVSSSWDNTIRVWALATGECLTAYHAGARVAYAVVDLEARVFSGASDGQVHFLKLRNVTPGVPTVTAVRVFRLAKPEAGKSVFEKLLPFLTGPTVGREAALTFTCPSCGVRSPVPAKVLEVIIGVSRSAGLKPEQAPCVSLPAEAWADARLQSACPQCKQAVRFNPFFGSGQ